MIPNAGFHARLVKLAKTVYTEPHSEIRTDIVDALDYNIKTNNANATDATASNNSLNGEYSD